MIALFNMQLITYARPFCLDSFVQWMGFFYVIVVGVYFVYGFIQLVNLIE